MLFMPGKYLVHGTFTVNGLSYSKEKFSSTDHKSATVETTLQLELYDMVQVNKNYDEASQPLKNYFEGWMLA